MQSSFPCKRTLTKVTRDKHSAVSTTMQSFIYSTIYAIKNQCFSNLKPGKPIMKIMNTFRRKNGFVLWTSLCIFQCKMFFVYVNGVVVGMTHWLLHFNLFGFSDIHAVVSRGYSWERIFCWPLAIYTLLRFEWAYVNCEHWVFSVVSKLNNATCDHIWELPAYQQHLSKKRVRL